MTAIVACAFRRLTTPRPEGHHPHAAARRRQRGLPLSPAVVDVHEWFETLRPSWYSAGPALHLAILEAARAHPEGLGRQRPRFASGGGTRWGRRSSTASSAPWASSAGTLRLQRGRADRRQHPGRAQARHGRASLAGDPEHRRRGRSAGRPWRARRDPRARRHGDARLPRRRDTQPRGCATAGSTPATSAASMKKASCTCTGVCAR